MDVFVLKLSLVICIFVCQGGAKYSCICNYNVETPVLPDPSPDGSPIGYLYEFDCKPKVTDASSPAWIAIAFEHKIGFIQNISQTQEQMCSGSVPQGDKVWTISTTRPVSTTHRTTTRRTPEYFTINHKQYISERTLGLEPGTLANTTKLSLLTKIPILSRTNVIPTISSTLTIPQITGQFRTSLTSSILSTDTTALTTKQPDITARTRSTSQPFSRSLGTIGHTTRGTILSNSWTSIVTTPILNTIVPGDTSRCPSSVSYQNSRDHGTLGFYNNSCYELISSVSVAHEHALQMCRSRGGDLVDIQDLQEQKFVQAFLLRYSPKHAVWIGLHDRINENYFQWTSEVIYLSWYFTMAYNEAGRYFKGVPVMYTNWMPGHTSNFVSHHQEDCVVMVPYKQGLWDDIPCGTYFSLGTDLGEKYPPLCEYKLFSRDGIVFVG